MARGGRTSLPTEPTIVAFAERRGRDRAERADSAQGGSEERYRDLFDDASDLSHRRPEPVSTLRQPRLAGGNGYGRTNPGLQLSDILHPDSRSTTRSDEPARRERLDHVEPVSSREPACRSWSRETSVALQGRCPVGDPGTYRDVTERKKVEEDLRRAERMQAAGSCWRTATK